VSYVVTCDDGRAELCIREDPHEALQRVDFDDVEAHRADHARRLGYGPFGRGPTQPGLRAWGPYCKPELWEVFDGRVEEAAHLQRSGREMPDADAVYEPNDFFKLTAHNRVTREVQGRYTRQAEEAHRRQPLVQAANLCDSRCHVCGWLDTGDGCMSPTRVQSCVVPVTRNGPIRDLGLNGSIVCYVERGSIFDSYDVQRTDDVRSIKQADGTSFYAWEVEKGLHSVTSGVRLFDIIGRRHDAQLRVCDSAGVQPANYVREFRTLCSGLKAAAKGTGETLVDRRLVLSLTRPCALSLRRGRVAEDTEIEGTTIRRSRTVTKIDGAPVDQFTGTMHAVDSVELSQAVRWFPTGSTAEIGQRARAARTVRKRA
jgi:hypothetical protein